LFNSTTLNEIKVENIQRLEKSLNLTMYLSDYMHVTNFITNSVTLFKTKTRKSLILQD